MTHPWPENHVGHWWTGRPGAHCMRCGCGDPVEEAVADGLLDPWDGEWKGTKAEKEAFDVRQLCPADTVGQK